MALNLSSENPRAAGATPPFPQETLEYPGLESEMTPVPTMARSRTRAMAGWKGRRRSSRARTVALAGPWRSHTRGRGLTS